ncbi:MAG: N-acetyltransferase [Acidobacteriota bacterium]
MEEIRFEQPGDIEAVRKIYKKVFDQPVEAEIVDTLRTSCKDLISLVALFDSQVVGHILFSPATLSSPSGTLRGMGLAPMAVLPRYQGRGIGSSLVLQGIQHLRDRGCPYVIVLGHPEYYPRFGFIPASQRKITCQWKGVPREAFMILVLEEKIIPKTGGEARYMDEFDTAI